MNPKLVRSFSCKRIFRNGNLIILDLNTVFQEITSILKNLKILYINADLEYFLSSEPLSHKPYPMYWVLRSHIEFYSIEFIYHSLEYKMDVCWCRNDIGVTATPILATETWSLASEYVYNVNICTYELAFQGGIVFAKLYLH